MPEGSKGGLSFRDLESLVKANKATPDQMREYQIIRDLGGLPGERVYERESHFTKEWICEYCGEGPIPCAIDCPQCGHPRPKSNHDPEQEGTMGSLRKRAGYRG